MYCTKCGHESPEGAAFCRACGTAISPSPVNPAAPVSPSTPPDSPVIFAATPSGMAAYVPPTSPSVSPSLMARYAGFWLRFVAYLIDSAILTVVFGAILAACFASFGVRFFRGFSSGMYDRPNVSYEPAYPYPWHPLFPGAALSVLLVLIPLTIVAGWLYFALMESSAHQGTLGKMALGLFVTDLQGRRITFARATGRFFAKIVTGLIPFLIGYMMAGFTEKRQALHDMIAACLVLKKI